MNSTKKKRKPGLGGKIFFAIYFSLTIILCTAIAIGLGKLWGFLKEYEQSQQVYAVDVILAELNSGNYSKIFEGLDAEISPYETGDDLRRQVTSRINGEFTSAKSAKYSTEESPAYLLKCGGENLAVLALKKTSKTPKYGMDIYGFDRIYGIEAQRNERAEVVVPSNCTFTINGKAPDGESFTEEHIPEAEYFGKYLDNEPAMRSYVFEKLMFQPEIRFFDKNGSPLPTLLENNVYSCALPTIDNEAAKDAEEFAFKFAKEYNKYIAYDTWFQSLAKYIPSDTEFYENLRTFNAQYYAPHSGYDFRDEKFLGTTQYSDECFSVSLEYDYVVISHGNEVPFHNSYTIFTVKTQKGWQAVNLILN